MSNDLNIILKIIFGRNRKLRFISPEKSGIILKAAFPANDVGRYAISDFLPGGKQPFGFNSLTSHEAKAGDSVKITLSVKDFSAVTNPKDAAENTIDQLFSAVQLKIYYDSSALDIVEYGAADEKNGTPSPVKISG